MLKHYFTIAFRDLIKYKIQTIISIIGLAVGFVCFSLSTVWIQFERSFDTFHPKSHRIYQLYSKSERETDSSVRLEAVEKIAARYPEIEDVALISRYSEVEKSGITGTDIYIRRVNESFFNVFDIDIKDLRKDTPPSIIITDKASKKVFPEQDPIGKDIVSGKKYELRITDVIPAWPLNTNIEFDVLRLSTQEANIKAYILVKEGTDVKLFSEKLLSFEYEDNTYGKTYFEIIPVTEVRQYESNNSTISIKYDNIKTFVFLGLLIIICAFLNYMILFINRIKIRKAELALRKVNGASNSSFIFLFGSEFFLLLVTSLLVSGLFIQLILPEFRKMSEITLENIDIYVSGLIYSLILVMFVFAISIVPLQYYKTKTLRQIINKQSEKGSKNILYHVSLLLQLIIGISFSFCTVVFIKQVQFLQRKTIGYDYSNVTRVNAWNVDATSFVDQVKKYRMLLMFY